MPCIKILFAFSNVTAFENNELHTEDTTDHPNLGTYIVKHKEASNYLIKKDAEPPENHVSKSEIDNLQTSFISLDCENSSKNTDITSLTKNSPSMLNELADAIIAENFDALKCNEGKILLSNYDLDKKPGMF